MNSKYEALKEKKGVTDYQVSKDTGIPRSTISEWSSGKYIPKIDKLLKLAEYFGVSVEDLLEENT
jgi:transcriptional regulator with XRE-family HTH domain